MLIASARRTRTSASGFAGRGLPAWSVTKGTSGRLPSGNMYTRLADAMLASRMRGSARNRARSLPGTRSMISMSPASSAAPRAPSCVIALMLTVLQGGAPSR